MIIILAAAYFINGLLGNEKPLPKVVLFLHHVRQAFVGNVKQIDKGLHISRLKQVRADALTAVVFVFICRHVVIWGWVFLLLLLPSQHELKS